MPDFGYIVEPGLDHATKKETFAVVFLNAEFGDDIACRCTKKEWADMICAALNKQMQEAIEAAPLPEGGGE